MSTGDPTRTLSHSHRIDPTTILLKRAEVAQKLRVSVRTVDRWADEGRIQRVRLAPKSIRFRAADVAALINPINDHDPADNRVVGKMGDGDAQQPV